MKPRFILTFLYINYVFKSIVKFNESTIYTLFLSSVGHLKIYINFVPKINLSRRRSIGVSQSGKYFMWEKEKFSEPFERSLFHENRFIAWQLLLRATKTWVKTNNYLSNFEQSKKTNKLPVKMDWNKSFDVSFVWGRVWAHLVSINLETLEQKVYRIVLADQVFLSCARTALNRVDENSVVHIPLTPLRTYAQFL